jgi:hypothetical protein
MDHGSYVRRNAAVNERLKKAAQQLAERHQFTPTVHPKVGDPEVRELFELEDIVELIEHLVSATVPAAK